MTQLRDSTGPGGSALSQRQAAILRAMVMAYLGEGTPIGSTTLSHLMPVSLSSASIRSTMAELAALGLVEKPHASSGRLPTQRGLRLFIDELLDPGDLASYEKRAIAFSVDEAEAGEVATVASQLLSERTRLLGFVVTPRIDRTPLRRVALVRLSRERVLAVLVSKSGAAQHRILEDDGALAQPELDRIATLISERLAGLTLRDLRERLQEETRELRHAADLLARALEIGARLLEAPSPEPEDLVIATRLALLEQPEFQDPRRLRELLEALEERERLLRLLDGLVDGEGVQVVLGDELDEPALCGCALVATPYGAGPAPLGALGVIGPRRMDFGRAIALVGYLSGVMTEKLNA